jgi:hypothetical protein
MHLVAHLALACAAAVGRPHCHVGGSVKWQYIEVRHASVDKIGVCAIPRFGSGFDSVNGAHIIISGRTKKEPYCRSGRPYTIASIQYLRYGYVMYAY